MNIRGSVFFISLAVIGVLIAVAAIGLDSKDEELRPRVVGAHVNKVEPIASTSGIASMDPLVIPRNSASGDFGKPTKSIASANLPFAHLIDGNTIEKLINAGTRKDLLDAVAVLNYCVRSQEMQAQAAGLHDGDAREALDSHAKENGDRCKTIPQWRIASRTEILAGLIEKGDPEAMVMWVNAGPNGDMSMLDQRPDDPFVIEWKDKAVSYLERAAESGSLEAIGQLQTLYSVGDESIVSHDEVKALAYAMAMTSVMRFQGAGEKSLLGQQRVVELAKGKVDKSGIDKASEIAEEIFKNCCAQK